MTDDTMKAVEQNEVEPEVKKDTFQRDLEMLRFFQEEFFYRHKRYWDLLMKTFVLSVVVSVLPIFSSIFDIQMKELPVPTLIFFPVVGICIAALSYVLLSSEARRMNAVNGKKYQLNHRLGEEYWYIDFTGGKKKKSIANFTIKIVVGLEILIAVAVIWILMSNYLTPVVPAT